MVEAKTNNMLSFNLKLARGKKNERGHGIRGPDGFGHTGAHW